MRQPTLSIIIPYKDDPTIHKTLKALLPQIGNTPWVEVIIVDDASKTPLLPSHISTNLVSILRQEINTGSYNARNIGASHASSNLLAFLDSDCIPSSNWVNHGINLMLNNPYNTMIGGPVKVYPQCTHKTGTEILEMATAFNMKHYATKRNFLGAGNLFIRKDTFNKVGQFDGSLTGGGDTEFGNRAVSMGVKLLYDPKLLVHHRAYKWPQVKSKIHRMVDNYLQRCEIENRSFMDKLWAYHLPGIPTIGKHFKVLHYPNATRIEKIRAILSLYAKSTYGLYYLYKSLTAKQLPKKTRWMLPGKAYDWIYQSIPPQAPILEFGSGYGSAHLATKYNVYSVEHNPDWVNLFPNVNYIHSPLTHLNWYGHESILSSIVNSPTFPKPHLTIIDGPPESLSSRSNLLQYQQIYDYITKNSQFILVDDTHRLDESLLANALFLSPSMKRRYSYTTHDKRRFTILETKVR